MEFVIYISKGEFGWEWSFFTPDGEEVEGGAGKADSAVHDAITVALAEGARRINVRFCDEPSDWDGDKRVGDAVIPVKLRPSKSEGAARVEAILAVFDEAHEPIERADFEMPDGSEC